MQSKQIAQMLRNVLEQVELEQHKCRLNGVEINKYKYVIDHLTDAIELLDAKEPWV